MALIRTGCYGQPLNGAHMPEDLQPDRVDVIGRGGSYYVIVTHDGVESETGPYDNHHDAYKAASTHRQVLGLPKRPD